MIRVFQDWTSVQGSPGEIVQTSARFLDLQGYAQASFFLDVADVATGLTLHYDTAVPLEPQVWQSIASEAVAAATSTPIVTRIRLWSNQSIPLAGLIRWRIVSANAIGATFRIVCLAKYTKGAS